MTVKLRPLVAVLTLLTLSLAPAPAVAAELGKVVPLPLPGFGDMQVDPVSQRVFVAGGDQIAVLDRDGKVLRTINGQTGVTGLSLSASGTEIHAALNGANAISVIDIKKMREVRRYPTGTLCPGETAEAVGRIWFTSGCAIGTYSGGLSALDPGTLQTTTYVTNLPIVRGVPFLALADREGWPVTLFVTANELNGSQIRTFDITWGEPDPVCWNPGGCLMSLPDIIADATLTTDKSQAVISSGAQAHSIVPVFGLSIADTYPSGPYPVAAAVGAGDLLALGSWGPSAAGPDLHVYPWGGDTPVWTHDFGDRVTAYNDLAPRGLAWGAGNTRLYAVTTDREGAAPWFNVLIP